MGIFEKFKIGFKRSASNIASGLKEIIVKKEIDDATLDKIEEFLIGSDVGIDAASEIKSIIAQKKIDPKNDPIKEVFEILNNYILELMTPLEKKDFFLKKEKTNIIFELSDQMKVLMGDTPINLNSPEQLSQVIYSRKVIKFWLNSKANCKITK